MILKYVRTFMLCYCLLVTDFVLATQTNPDGTGQTDASEIVIDTLSTENQDVAQANPDDLAFAVALEELQEQAAICKNEDGSWKNGSVRNPKYDQLVAESQIPEWALRDRELTQNGAPVPRMIDCLQFVQLEFELQKELIDEDDNQQLQSKALNCSTEGWDPQAQLAFARQLEGIGALDMSLEEHFGCAGRDETTLDCAKDVGCNLLNSGMDSVGVMGILDSIGVEIPRCPSSTDTNCLNEVFWGIWKGLVGTWEGIKFLGSAAADLAVSAWDGIASLWRDSETLENELSTKQIALEDAEDGFFDKFMDDPLGTTQKMFESMMTMVKQHFMDNFGCAQWDKPRAVGLIDGEGARCLKPLVSMDCATCGQTMNMICGLGGEALELIIEAFLTGGTVAAAKALTQAGRATKAGAAIARSMGAVGNYMGRLGAKTQPLVKLFGRAGTWVGRNGKALGLFIGRGFSPITNRKSIQLMLRAIRGTAKVTGKVGGAVYRQTLKKYFNAMEISYFAGHRQMSNMAMMLRGRQVARGASLADNLDQIGRLRDLNGDDFGRFSGEMNRNKQELERLYKELNDVGTEMAVRGGDAVDPRFTQLRDRINQLEDQRRGIIARANTRADDIQETQRRLALQQQQQQKTAGGTAGNTADEVDNGALLTQRTDNANDDVIAVGQGVDANGPGYQASLSNGVANPVDEVSEFVATHRATRMSYGDNVDDFVVTGRVTSSTPDSWALGQDVLRVQLDDGTIVFGRIKDRVPRTGNLESITLVKQNGDEVTLAASQFNVANVRNLHDTRHMSAFQNAHAFKTNSPGDLITFTRMNGDEIAGELIEINAKSIKIKKADGTFETIATKDINLTTLSRTRNPANHGMRRLDYEENAQSMVMGAGAATTRPGSWAKGQDVLRIPLDDGTVAFGRVLDRSDDSVTILTRSGENREIPFSRFEMSDVRNLHDTRHMSQMNGAAIRNGDNAGDTIRLTTMQGQEVTGELVRVNPKRITLVQSNGDEIVIRTRDIDLNTLNRTRPTGTALTVRNNTDVTTTRNRAGGVGGSSGGARTLDELVGSGNRIKIQFVDDGRVVREMDQMRVMRISRDGEHHAFKNAANEYERVAWKYEGYTPDYSKLSEGILIYRRGSNYVPDSGHVRAVNNAIENGTVIRGRIGTDNANFVLVRRPNGRVGIMKKVGDDLLEVPTNLPLKFFMGATILAEALRAMADVEIEVDADLDPTPTPVPTATPTPDATVTPTPTPDATPGDGDRVDPDAEDETEDEEEDEDEDDDDSELDEGNPVGPPTPPNMPRPQIHIKRGIF
ncbi:MAG: hypothetical protein GY909_17250 [Oligoflexia bacterium]|nr:hypothetical protein [Oligoflexia bacterium]